MQAIITIGMIMPTTIPIIEVLLLLPDPVSVEVSGRKIKVAFILDQWSNIYKLHRKYTKYN